MQPEIPNVDKFILADRTNYTVRPSLLLRTGHPYDLIVIHCTDGHERAEPVAEMWQEPHHGSSAHLVIGQDATVIQCVPLAFAAYHAHTANSHSIGIEHSARTPNELSKDDPGLPPSDAQLLKSAKIVAYLLKAAALPVDRDHVKGHREADPLTTHTRCPDGCGWPWDAYMNMVRDEYAKLGSAPLVA